MNKFKISQKLLIIILLVIQIINIYSVISVQKAQINDGDTLLLKGSHECDSLVEYWMTDYKKWSYKIVWYVYYEDKSTNEKYPAFCVEPAKEGVGTGYNEYNTYLSKNYDNVIWRILNKGYMCSSYKDWNLECDDDLYSATKIALHSYKEGVNPKDKYIIGTRSVDGNTIEEIQRRGRKVLDVAQTLYDYGIKGNEKYEEPKIDIIENEDAKIELIGDKEYYVKEYKVNSNKALISYEVNVNKIVTETLSASEKVYNSEKLDSIKENIKILDSDNQEKNVLNNKNFKLAIPIEILTQDMQLNISIKNAKVKTNPVYYCKSSISKAQSYVTYTADYEVTSTDIKLDINANNSSLSLVKIDSESKSPIEGVMFEIKTKEGNLIGLYSTDKNGIIKIEGLLPGTVILKEISVPNDYEICKDEKEITLEWGKETKVEIKNDPIIGKIKIKKVSADNNYITYEQKGTPLSNVKFEIYSENKEFIEEIITNEGGIATSNNLKKGKYLIKEIETKEGYILDETEIEIEILNNNQLIELTLENKPKEVKKLPKTGF